MSNQSGLIPMVVIIVIMSLMLAVVVYFGLDKFNNMTFFRSSLAPAPEVLQTTSNSAKQELYEQNREKIKADLNLTEREFQALKRFSAED